MKLGDANALLSTTDAMAWANEFCRMYEVRRYFEDDSGLSEPVDDNAGLMLTWFANAICTGEMSGREQTLRDVEEGLAKSFHRFIREVDHEQLTKGWWAAARWHARRQLVTLRSSRFAAGLRGAARRGKLGRRPTQLSENRERVQ